ncbi:hypothetical protein NMY22_g13609 [Coprinellus aureogranulatus]|nr:hypothetical protein NMY22_g13609 [Coprinellus aureogranulatus]
MAQSNWDTQQKIDAQIANLEQELLELKRRRNELSPVSTIPPEVLCHILLLATTHARKRDFTGAPEKLRVNGCMNTLCHVSHFWRLTALGCPQLWAGIDVGTATDPRLVDFMVQNAQPYPISFFIKAESPELEALDEVKRAVSGGASFDTIAASGRLDVLNSVLYVAQPKSLRALRIFVSDTGTLGYAAAGISIAKNPLFTRSTPGLRHLSIEGFAIPLTSQILTRSIHLTSLSLPIQRGGNLSHVINILSKMPLLQRLYLHLLGPLQVQQGTIDPVLLPSMLTVILKGDSVSVITILSNLRLSAMHLDFSFFCRLRSDSNPQQEGMNLFKALGEARCRPASIRVKAPSDHPFSPNVIGFGREPPLAGVDAVSRMMFGNWAPLDGEHQGSTKDYSRQRTSVRVLTLFQEHSTFAPMPWTQWHPLVVGHHPVDFRRFSGWSMDELRWIMLDNEVYPDSLWQFLSQCPNISDIFFSIRQASQLLAPDLVRGTLPFPSLRRLEVGRTPFNMTADASRPLETEYEALFESFFEVLKQRRNILSKHGVKREWVLDHLNLVAYPPGVPIKRFVQFARDHGLIREPVTASEHRSLHKPEIISLLPIDAFDEDGGNPLNEGPGSSSGPVIERSSSPLSEGRNAKKWQAPMRNCWRLGNWEMRPQIFPFPRLRKVEVSGIWPPETTLDDVLKPMVAVLEVRLRLAVERGLERSGGLEHLSRTGPLKEPQPLFKDVPPSLIKLIDWKKKPEPSAQPADTV